MCAILLTINKSVRIRMGMGTFNALSVYMVIWALMLIFYHLKFINYPDLSNTTWIIIFTTTFIVAMGNILGKCLKLNPATYDVVETNQDTILRIIKILTVISLFAIVPNTLWLIQRYGIHVLSKTNEIYYANLRGEGTRTIPYIGYCAQAATILAGTHIALYGFKASLLVPVFLSVVNILPSGSRGNIIISILALLLPYLLLKNNNKSKQEDQTLQDKRGNQQLRILAVAMVILFIIMTINRSQGITSNTFSYMSNRMVSVATRNPALYKLYQYFTGPVGVLNAFLEKPEFAFGQNTFATIYNLLNRLGANIEVSRYQTFYMIPFRSNVGTWIRELISDFSYFGMYLVIFIVSIIEGYLEHKAHISRRASDVYIATIMAIILIMSFFVWYIREGSMVMLILFYFLVNLFSNYRFTLHAQRSYGR